MRAEWFFILLSLTIVTCEYSHVDLALYDNYTIPDLRFMCFNYNVTANVSDSCAEQLDIVCRDRDLLMTMLDASSKFPYPGLGFASRSDYGNYDQCMTAAYEYDGGKILGQHCVAGLLIPDLLGNVTDISRYYRLSICKPDGCTNSDFNNIAQQINPNFPPLFQDLICSNVETGTTLTIGDIVTITILALCSFLMVISTVYDICISNANIKCHHPLFLAFSVLSNGRKLLHVSKPTASKEQIHCFNGLRVISMMWIVAGHGFAGWQALAVTNAEKAGEWLNQRYAGYIATAPLAVDTFFFISGFLLAFHYLKQKAKPLLAQLSGIPYMYLHRYLRITPALLMLYLVTISIFRYFGSGPVWNYAANGLAEPCKRYWWTFFLYIQNYYNYDDFCLTQTWYLSADMQMFLLSPLILIPMSLQLKNRSGFNISMLELLVINLFCIALPLTIKLVFQDYTNAYDTHSRLINYFIGMMLAVFMRVKIDKPFLYSVNEQYRSITNLIVWIIILLGMFTLIMFYQEVEMNHGYESKSVFYSLMRPFWCIGLSWIVYACYHGQGGFINWMLTMSIYQPLGRLTYAIYLMHGLVVAGFVMAIRTTWYFSDYQAFYVFCGHYVMSLVIAVFWVLAFESPIIIVEKYLLGGGNKKRDGIVNGILSNPFMQVISRFTYCIYLVHALVIYQFIASSVRIRLYFSDYILFYEWCGNYIMSLVLAVYWTLAFESPLIIIEKYIFGNPKRKPALSNNMSAK